MKILNITFEYNSQGQFWWRHIIDWAESDMYFERNRGLSFYHWSVPEQTIEQTIETPMFWDAIALIMTSL